MKNPIGKNETNDCSQKAIIEHWTNSSLFFNAENENVAVIKTIINIDPSTLPKKANDEDQKEVGTWTNNDETKMNSIIDHKIENKTVEFLVEYALEDDESDASLLKSQIEQDGGLWTPARALKEDAPVLMGRYIVKHNLHNDGAKTWKKLWDALKKKNLRKKSNKGAPPRKIPKTVMVAVSPEKKCKHCEDWQHYRNEENA